MIETHTVLEFIFTDGHRFTLCRQCKQGLGHPDVYYQTGASPRFTKRHHAVTKGNRVVDEVFTTVGLKWTETPTGTPAERIVKTFLKRDEVQVELRKIIKKAANQHFLPQAYETHEDMWREVVGTLLEHAPTFVILQAEEACTVTQLSICKDDADRWADPPFRQLHSHTRDEVRLRFARYWTEKAANKFINSIPEESQIPEVVEPTQEPEGGFKPVPEHADDGRGEISSTEPDRGGRVGESWEIYSGIVPSTASEDAESDSDRIKRILGPCDSDYYFTYRDGMRDRRHARTQKLTPAERMRYKRLREKLTKEF